jgi:glycosyltransferase involved in cell wall biosynthesis
LKPLIIVSPHFPPTNAADHQRVRIALPYFREQGWDPEVIAVAADDVSSPLDPFLTTTIPEDIPVHRVRVPAGAWTRLPGMGNVGYRSTPAIKRSLTSALRRIEQVSNSHPTLIYFSTTQFPVHGLIPSIRRHSGLRVVMDFQDRWVNDYYRRNPHIIPPGGRLKYQVDRWFATRTERKVLPLLDGFTQVSVRYGEELNERYPSIQDCPRLTLPFGAAESDFQTVQQIEGRQNRFDPDDGLRHWVSVGRSGPDMEKSLRALFRALRTQINVTPMLNQTLRLHFLGTDYAAGSRARHHVTPIARDEGVDHLVVETPHRLPYSETLRCLLDADALLVTGSDDEAYNASKLFPYLLARRPLLTVFHEASPACAAMRETKGGCLVTFNASSTIESIAESIGKHWFDSKFHERIPDTDWTAFSPYSARQMTQKLSNFFEQICALKSRAPL